MRMPFGRNRTVIQATREQLHLAAAVASEAVLDAHANFALELVDEGGDRVPVERLLSAYGRLHHLDDDARRQLTERVLARLGREPGEAGPRRLQQPRSVLRKAARRLRGRVHKELREWVDRHTARAQLAILEVHVEHALRFAHILFDQGSPDEAVGLYSETLTLRPTMAEMVRLRVLAEAPVHGEEPPSSSGADVEPLHPRPSLRLKLAEDGG